LEESKIRALILEEIQDVINQVNEKTKGTSSPTGVAGSLGEIVAKRLNGVKDKLETEKNQDSEIGKDQI